MLIDLAPIRRAHNHAYARASGDLTVADRESVEVSMLTLHLPQSALVDVNTALLQVILAEPVRAARG